MPATLVETKDRRLQTAPLVGAAAIAALTLFAILFLWVESETAVAGLLLAAAAVVGTGRRLQPDPGVVPPEGAAVRASFTH